MKIFEISPKMRCFGGKRWEKLWIRWNWPFRVNLSLILGEKIENVQKWPFWPNLSHFFGQICHCRSFSAAFMWNDLKKLENSKNLPMYPPPRNENFWDFSKNEMLWWQKMGKVVNQVKLTIPSQSQPHFGGKDRKMRKNGHFDPI